MPFLYKEHHCPIPYAYNNSDPVRRGDIWMCEFCHKKWICWANHSSFIDHWREYEPKRVTKKDLRLAELTKRIRVLEAELAFYRQET